MNVIEDEQVDASLEMLVRLDVGLDRLAREQRPLGAFDRNVDQREGRHFLGLAVLEDIEVVCSEVSDRVALRVGDERIDLDVVHFDAERDRRLVAGRLRCW